MFTKYFLIEVRKRALRQGKWYSALNDLERGIISLASQIIDKVQNSTLSIQIVKIISKLNYAFKSDFAKHLERYGIKRLREIQGQAKKFGHPNAFCLENDLEFIGYLTFLDYNQPIGWRRYE